MHDMILESRDGKLIAVTEGTGDSLLPEDVDAGYVDYVNYEVYNTLEQAQENEDAWSIDGGMVYLKTLYKDLTIEEVVGALEEETGLELAYKQDITD